MSWKHKHFICRVFYYVLSLSNYTLSGNIFWRCWKWCTVILCANYCTQNPFTSHLFLEKSFGSFQTVRIFPQLWSFSAEQNYSFFSVHGMSFLVCTGFLLALFSPHHPHAHSLPPPPPHFHPFSNTLSGVSNVYSSSPSCTFIQRNMHPLKSVYRSMV